MDDLVSRAVEVLLGAGWKGVLAALVLVLAYAGLRAAGVDVVAWIRRQKIEEQVVADENGPQIETPAEFTTGEPGGGPTGGMG